VIDPGRSPVRCVPIFTFGWHLRTFSRGLLGGSRPRGPPRPSPPLILWEAPTLQTPCWGAAAPPSVPFYFGRLCSLPPSVHQVYPSSGGAGIPGTRTHCRIRVHPGPGYPRYPGIAASRVYTDGPVCARILGIPWSRVFRGPRMPFLPACKSPRQVCRIPMQELSRPLLLTD
jgi:hypothetical protein